MRPCSRRSRSAPSITACSTPTPATRSRCFEEAAKMDLLTPELRAKLIANSAAHTQAMQYGLPEPDPAPMVKFFNPCGAATWLISSYHSFGRANAPWRARHEGRVPLIVRADPHR
ncbi:MAG: hypothetical protein C0429_09390 [Sphingopyxis sp.]|nr:hypothetical protein [Sphingopyxis sp.]